MGASIILAAAGSSSRMGGINKIMYKLNSKEAITYPLLAADKAACVDEIIIVTSEDIINDIKALIEKLKLSKMVKITLGNTTRQGSVMNALKEVDDKCDVVMIHDAARVLITSKLIDKIYNETLKKGACALCMPAKDTIKVVNEQNEIVSTPDRKTLYIAQTPQSFDLKLYKDAVKKAVAENKDYTDDCQLVEAFGKSVYVVEGSYENFKLTTKEDLILAEAILKEREND
ncbi:MAG: 2-C-methyl-D-erythritol 4-phosphate cytidylyltransferase [Oscillospiraceae bacterium]|nr:2-C-methyl-D-erythritol 4-phosphate cytidylyltransferase [Oscillospiraceae bacterium]